MGFLKEAAGGIAQGLLGLGGAALQGHQAGEAAKLQAASSDKALAWEKEKEAKRRQDWEKGMAIWSAGRKALASRYGLDLGDVMPGDVAGGPAPAGGPPAAGPTGGASPANLAALMQGGEGEVPPELGSTFDWRRYNLRQ